MNAWQKRDSSFTLYGSTFTTDEKLFLYRPSEPAQFANFVPSLVAVVVFVCQKHRLNSCGSCECIGWNETKTTTTRGKCDVLEIGSVCECLVCAPCSDDDKRCLRRADGWRYLPQHMCSFVIIENIHTFFGVIDCAAKHAPDTYTHSPLTQRKWDNSMDWYFNVKWVWLCVRDRWGRFWQLKKKKANFIFSWMACANGWRHAANI